MRQVIPEVPADYAARIKAIRMQRELTQIQFATLLGVSFASVNRWENEQARPTRLAWTKIAELEIPNETPSSSRVEQATVSAPGRQIDFAGRPDAVAAVAEAHRLSFGHLFNPAFATETSLIDPLPHQRLAVYDHMLGQSPLRFLLADDAGAGKTIMTGLYLREMLARRLLKRVLIVPPAGLVGNWQREMRGLFGLEFKIVTGSDARHGNPFVGTGSERVICSLDTLRQETMFARLRDSVLVEGDAPYDFVVFDEAHKLSADRDQDFRVRKTDRYRLAEALAGIAPEDERWNLGWSAANLLLLTATPHMGKDVPYYYLWRLLLPDALATYDAFEGFPEASRRRHFLRRTKEEMVRFDGTPLYPQRVCSTLSYELGKGADGEQALYDETTEYIRDYYNLSARLNRSAARLAMSVFQRRLASSTFALMRSFERRAEKLDAAIAELREGRLDRFLAEQRRLERVPDLLETETADEDLDEEASAERHEANEAEALGATTARDLADLNIERDRVIALLGRARALVERGEESKFEKLREVIRDERFRHEKLIVFTEHRDTAMWLMRRLEGLGYTGKVAQIHGGLDYRDREAQVELFRKPQEEGGSGYLVATDAAGEGINLQFCWLMVNYDIPWNPARLEQRMGRIHRYGQKRDPVIIVNLVAGSTREGRVLKTLLEKLDAIRRRLRSDKVFDVVGRLFSDVPLKRYLEMSIEDADAAAEKLSGTLTDEQVEALFAQERRIYGDGGDVKRRLDALNEEMEREQYRRLLPGYVRRLVERAAPLLDLAIDGEPEQGFAFRPLRARALDPLLPALDLYSEPLQSCLSVRRPATKGEAIWLHPGEPVFDRLCSTAIARFGSDAARGACFVDPAAQRPYLFHIASVTVERAPAAPSTDVGLVRSSTALRPPEIVEQRLIGLRQYADGQIEEAPVEHLLLLRGAPEVAPGSVPLAGLARKLDEEAQLYLEAETAKRLVEAHRAAALQALPERLAFVANGFDHQTAELVAARARLTDKARAGDAASAERLASVKARQKMLGTLKDGRLAELRAEPDRFRAGEVAIVARALVVPSSDPAEQRRFDIEVSKVAMRLAASNEEARGAMVLDVSTPELARRAALSDWPGFDILSRHAEHGERAIEVKGRADVGPVELTENEWAKACVLRDRYWLYVVFGCAGPVPRLIRIRDPFGRLVAREVGRFVIDAAAIERAATSE